MNIKTAELFDIYHWRWQHRFPLQKEEDLSALSNEEFSFIQSANQGYDFVIDGDNSELILVKQENGN